MAAEIIKTNSGPVQGVEEGACVVYKGIPYAKPPVGGLRWKAPEKAEPWTEVLKADHFGNQSAQRDWSNAPETPMTREFHQDPVSNNPASENGLFLNIWTPKEKSETLMPVAFYIHGGAFMGGCGHEITFRTEAYAKKGVILVTINYRLGIYGFLAHPWLEKEDSRACGNYGILDQITALEWVRENIRFFGGDPDNITIFGQSAGCMSVQAILSIPSQKGRFSKAILQSGASYPALLGKLIPMDEALKRGGYAVEAAGVHSLEEFRAISETEMCQIQEKVYARVGAMGGGLAFSPVENHVLFPGSEDQLVEEGRIADVPMIIGTTKNDMTVTLDEVLARDSRFQAGCRRWALKMEENHHSPCYVYYFTRDLPGDNAQAFHSSELWYMFGTLGKCWRPMTEADYQLSETMVSYWTNFMKSGKPNGTGLPQWPSYTREHPCEMILDVKCQAVFKPVDMDKKE
ncbi:para-nitrobenzyl esterase [Catenibacillus scindens]|uniref:Carboxylic ester hydrolase n=1 Tax=Catenibacillus scindens TaxID=673271 RepID=A0A7W8M6Z0_9FIRM|nr:carboxylesterase family protein [Catenibacillus scindens]MBB5266092.1 para-nitrobenzyl esterase [Catenibacillus scindens]